MLYINFSVTCLQFAPKRSLSYFQPILAAFFVTIATVKVESIPGYCSNELIRKTCKEQLLFFDLIGGGGGGQNSLLIHLPLSNIFGVLEFPDMFGG